MLQELLVKGLVVERRGWTNCSTAGSSCRARGSKGAWHGDTARREELRMLLLLLGCAGEGLVKGKARDGRMQRGGEMVRVEREEGSGEEGA